MLLEERGIVEVPLVGKEDVDCVIRNDPKESRGEKNENSGYKRGGTVKPPPARSPHLISSDRRRDLPDSHGRQCIRRKIACPASLFTSEALKIESALTPKPFLKHSTTN